MINELRKLNSFPLILGAFISKIASFAKPLLQRVISSEPVQRGLNRLKSSAISNAKGFVEDIVSGHNVSESAKARLKNTRSDVLGAIFDTNEDQHTQSTFVGKTPRKVPRSRVKTSAVRGRTLFT